MAEEVIKTEEKLSEEMKEPIAPVAEDKKEVIENTPVVETIVVVDSPIMENVETLSKPTSVEKVEEAKIDVVATEKLSDVKDEIKTTKEELSVIKEVRNELVVLYSHNKELKVTNEQLTSELESTKKELSLSKEQLSKYMEAEKAVQAKEKNDRLEQLSSKFKMLGQEKSVEQLSTLDESIVKEFEIVVDLAIQRTGEITEAPAVTANSQSIEKLSTDAVKVEEKLSEAPAVAKTEIDTKKKVMKKEQLSNAFFKNICGTLSHEQKSVGNDRIRFM